ncbi:MocR-like pyridoxine biosynthesis transcription factor PdxR [Chitinilyticum litopenaei]|uniref:MocR-like pyridoxine biosynthesis transcription factor PdxR n=1 Tax=Chitinilyticum litopenaei TaxID=1121276 RepID=UPI00041ACCE0|nr:PLP-dependent aminotransferase family protein [Chitinilyticum litopenaei]
MPLAPALPTLFADAAQHGQTLQDQLARTLRQALMGGHWPQGSRLPASRQLAGDLGISRATVEAVYARLESEGYLQRRTGAGTFVAVAGTPPAAKSPRAGQAPALSRRGQTIVATGTHTDATTVLPFAAGKPDLQAFPHKLWQKLTQQYWQRDGQRLGLYGDPQGLPALRSAIAAYLAQSRGVVAEPGQIVVLSSSQQALQLIAQLLLDPGATVWLEDPGYLGARNAMLAAGAHAVPVPLDAEGLCWQQLPSDACRPNLIYTTPSHQYPMGISMSLPRRLALLELASQEGCWIIEDDYDGEYQYDQRPLPALQGLDRAGRVLYIGTFSKVLFPSLRLAYLVVPPDLVEPFVLARAALDGHSAQLWQAVTADFIRNGHFASHLRQMRTLYRSRRDLLVEELRRAFGAAVRPVHAGAGLQFAATVPPGCEQPWTAAGRRAGLTLRPLSVLHLDEVRQEGWLLGYAALQNSEIRQAVATLAAALDTKKGTRSTGARKMEE